jgi:hypothetical protein
MNSKIHEFKEWIENRINYWEDTNELDIDDITRSECRGELSAYLRVQQHINTTFGEWVKSEL